MIQVDDVPDTLDRWESELKGRLGTIDLLGELSLTDGDRQEIAFCLSVLLQAKSAEVVNKVIARVWPITLSSYLVAEGVASYEAGNYWGPICEATGLPRQTTSEWGNIFLQTLARTGKTDFSAMMADQRGVRYVTRILAHGGIPSYCLDDFFRDVLYRNNRTGLRGDEAEELINDWRGQRNPLPFADKPVKRFLIYGGPVALDFLNRCFQMAHAQEEALLDASNFGLPEFVVRRYRAFLSALSPAERRRGAGSEGSYSRFVRPWLQLDPWGSGVEVVLPEQTLTATPAGGQLVWTLSYGSESQAVRVPLLRRASVQTSSRQTMWLARPAITYVAKLSDGGSELRRWEIPGVSASSQVIAFSSKDGRSLDVAAGLSGEPTWLVLPEHHSIKVDGRAGDALKPLEVLEELPSPPGWRGYRALYADLTGYRRVILTPRGDEQQLVIPVRALAQEPSRPHLVGGDILWEVAPGSAGPLYSSMPELFIPVDNEATANRWQVQLRLPGRTAEAGSASYRLDEVPHLPVAGGVMLALEQVLNPKEIGAYSVFVRGPLGRDALLSFRYLPELRVSGSKSLILPQKQASVDLHVDAGTQISTDGDDTSVVPVLGPAPPRVLFRAFQLVPSPEIAVRYGRLLPDGAIVEVPLRIPVRRLRWGLVGLEGAGANVLAADTLTVEVESLLEAKDPLLVVDLPAEHDVTAVRISLVDADGELQGTDWMPGQGERRLRQLPLSAFKDSLRESRRAQQRLELLLRRETGGSETVTLGTVRQTPQITSLEIVVTGKEPQRLEVEWVESRPTADRSLLIWSLGRPWELPYVIDLRDSDGTWQDNLARQLPQGRYRAAIHSVDPWAGTAGFQLPRREMPGIADFVVAGGEASSLLSGASLDDLLADPAQTKLPVVELIEPLLTGEIRRKFGRNAEGRAIEACREPKELAAAVLALANILPFAYSPALQGLLVQSGAGSWSSRMFAEVGGPELQATDLWQSWRPLGLFFDLPQAIMGESEAEMRCRHYLGPNNLEELGEEEEMDQGPVIQGGIPAALKGLMDSASRLSSPAAKIIGGWQKDLAMGVLGTEALVLANYETLTKVSNGPNPEGLKRWLETNLPMLDQARQALGPRLALPRYLEDLLSADRDPASPQHNAAYVIDCVALFQRLTVWDPPLLQRAWGSTPDFTAMLSIARQFGPSLYVTRLCLFELALTLRYVE